MKTIIFMLTASIFATSSLAPAEEKENSRPPENFVRDVMAPTFMPVVSSYHFLRESVFLNTCDADAHGLEATGNFLLAPSRFLFGGKTIKIDDAGCKVDQSFRYDNYLLATTIGAIAALPVSQVLGIACKGLSFVSLSARKRHKKITQALHAPLTTSHLEEYLQAGIAKLHCEETIPCQGHKRPSQLSKKQKIEIAALKEIIAILDANNIVYWVDCGTCLGAYRYGGIIPWDWDIDVAILLQDHENVKRLLSQLDPKKYQIQDWSSYSKPKTFLKLYVKETKNFIDIYHYKIDEKEKKLAYLFTLQDSPIPYSWKKDELKCTKPLLFEEVFPLKKANFDGLTVWAPNNVEVFLQSKYGENLNPSMLWDEETHAYHKVKDHPYWTK